MDCIISAKSMKVGKAAGFTNDRLRHVEQHVSRPIGVERLDEAAVHRPRQASLPTPACERRAGFDIGNGGRRYEPRTPHTVANEPGAVLFDVELHESARIEVQRHRLPSMTALAIEAPRIRVGRADPRGLPPVQRATPSRTMASIRLSPSASAGGEMTAMGRPRSVTNTRSPVFTRPRNSLSLFLSSRMPTVVTIYCGHNTVRSRPHCQTKPDYPFTLPAVSPSTMYFCK